MDTPSYLITHLGNEVISASKYRGGEITGDNYTLMTLDEALVYFEGYVGYEKITELIENV